jgi:hypothetical protein
MHHVRHTRLPRTVPGHAAVSALLIGVRDTRLFVRASASECMRMQRTDSSSSFNSLAIDSCVSSQTESWLSFRRLSRCSCCEPVATWCTQSSSTNCMAESSMPCSSSRKRAAVSKLCRATASDSCIFSLTALVHEVGTSSLGNVACACVNAGRARLAARDPRVLEKAVEPLTEDFTTSAALTSFMAVRDQTCRTCELSRTKWGALDLGGVVGTSTEPRNAIMERLQSSDPNCLQCQRALGLAALGSQGRRPRVATTPTCVQRVHSPSRCTRSTT